jgi:hypothetical protein
VAARRDRELASSLFPFLSVLACVIGTLTLLIAALATNQVVEGLQARSADAPPPPGLETRRAAVRALQARLERARTVEAERAALEARLRTVGIAPSESPDEAARHLADRLASAGLARRLETLRRESRDLAEALAGMERALARPRQRDDRRAIRIHPQGRGAALRPFFVECRAEGVRIYHEGLDDSLFLDRKTRHGQSQFEVFLRRVRAIPSHTVVFLIRPDGVETYDWANEAATNGSVRHAKLPLPGHGEIEFAL